MKRLVHFTLLSLVAFALVQCDETSSPVRCDTSAFVKTELAREGRITFDKQVNAFVVVSAVEGTIDSQDFGIPCGLPKELQTAGLEVVFDGDYYHYEGDAEPVLGGQIYYRLELLKIKLK